MRHEALKLVNRLRLSWDSTPTVTLTDADLLARFIDANDEAAFTQLVQSHAGLVWTVCRRSLVSHADAEDAFQATFLILFQNAQRIRRQPSLSAWLHGVAWRITQKIKRSAVRRRQREQNQALPIAGSSSAASEELQREDMDLLHGELARLPMRYREPLLLCYVEGQSHALAAETLGWPVGTVAGRLARAKELLRSRLLRRGVAPAFVAGLATELSATGIPAYLIEKTLQTIQAGGASPIALLAQGVLGTMMLSKWVMLSVLGIGLSAATGIGWSAWKSHGETTLAAIAPGVVPMQPAASSDLEKIQGRWRWESRHEVTGTVLETEDLMFRGNKYARIRQGRETQAQEFVLENRQPPKRLELQEWTISEAQKLKKESSSALYERRLFTYELEGDTLTLIGGSTLTGLGKGLVPFQKNAAGEWVPNRNSPLAVYLRENDPGAVKMVFHRLPPTPPQTDEEIAKHLKSGEVAFELKLNDPRYRGPFKYGDLLTILATTPDPNQPGKFKYPLELNNIELLWYGNSREDDHTIRFVFRVTQEQALQLKAARELKNVHWAFMNQKHIMEKVNPLPVKPNRSSGALPGKAIEQADVREKELMDQRIDALQQRYQLQFQEYKSGKATCYLILDSIKERLQAKLERAGGNQLQAESSLKEALNSASDIETISNAKLKVDAGTELEVATAKAARLEYELRLLRLEKSKK